MKQGLVSRIFPLLAAMALLSPVSSFARGISPEEAGKAASNWVRRNPHPLESRTLSGAGVKEVRTKTDGDGAALFHVVRMEDGGVVVASAESRITPVIAFADCDDIEESEENPLWDILCRDMAERAAAFSGRRADPRRRDAAARGRDGGGAAFDDACAAAEAEWEELLSDAPVPRGLDAVGDVRVSPLVQSTWGQSTVGSGNCYNYSTPENCVCGCVSTAGAQLMRFHQFPTSYVTPVTRDCTVKGTPVSKTMIGGTYAWSSMPLSPLSSMTTAQRQAIGKLCYDIGVTVYTKWGVSNSGAPGYALANSFKDVFGYASAKVFCRYQSNLTPSEIKNAIFANLDAGCPVVLGIENHEVVGDGYGYSSGTPYTHINIGWDGWYDAWYNLPLVDYAYDSDVLDHVVYNVFPSKTGDLLTGRVTNTSGNPVSGATVKAVCGGTTFSGTTNAKGIFALYVAGGNTYSVTATSGGASSTISVYVTQSVSTTVSGIYFTLNTGTVGNSWGNDITIKASAPSAPSSVTAADGSSTANVTVSWGAVSGAASYTLYRGTTSSPTTALASGLTSASYTDTSATPGTLYYYRVKAVNSAGSSGYSASDSGYRKLSAPTISSATGSASGVALSWGAVTGATHYRVSRATSSTGAKTDLGSWQTGTTYTDTSGTAGTTYYYFVRAAVDSSGTRPSSYSASKTGAKTKSTAPSAPGSVSATDGSSTANVTITWGAVSGAASYTLYRGTTSTPTTALASGLTSASYTDTSATPGTLYYYRVKAVNSAGSSGYSASDSGYRKLAAPAISSATGSASGVALSWSAVTGATHYRVFRATTSSGTKTALGSWQTGTSYTDTSGTAGTTYYYFVQAAVDSSGTRPSAYSAAATGVKPSQRPANDDFASSARVSGYYGTVYGDNVGATKQSGEPAHAGIQSAGKSVWWTWTAPTSGEVVIDTVGSSFDTVLAVYTGTAVGSLSAVDSNDDAIGTASRVIFNAVSGTTYRIAVSSGYDGAEGDIALSWSLAVPNAPNILAGSGLVTVSGKKYYRLSFKAKSGKSYRIQRKASLPDASWTTVKTVTASSTGIQSVDVALVTGARSAFYRVVTTE